MENTITIPNTRYDELVKAEAFLDALEAFGVDNWDGYSDAWVSIQPKADNA